MPLRIKKILLLTLLTISASILLIYLSIWAFSPPLSRYFLNDWLARQGIELSPEASMRFNPFMTRLSIDNLVLSKAGGEVLMIKSLSAEARARALPGDDIHISQFHLKGLFLDVTIQDGALQVAGLNLPLDDTDSNAATPERAIDDNIKRLLKLILPMLKISDSKIQLTFEGDRHLLAINEFKLTNVIATDAKQRLSLSLNGNLDQAPLALNANIALIDREGDITVDISLEHYDLAKLTAFLPKTITSLAGKLSLNSRQTFKLGKQTINIAVTKADIATDGLTIHSGDHIVSTDTQVLNVHQMSLDLNEDAPAKMSVQADWQSNNGIINLLDDSSTLASWAKLTADEIDIAYSKGVVLGVKQLTITQLLASASNRSPKLPPLARSSAIEIKNIKITDNSLAINSINVDALVAELILDSQQQLMTLLDLGGNKGSANKTSTEPKTTEPKIKENTASAFTLSLQQFSLSGDSQLHFLDKSVTPPYERTVYFDKLVSGPFDSAQPKQHSPFVLEGRSDKYAIFKLSGYSAPFSTALNLQLNGDINELNLPPVSVYIKKALGYEMQSGELDAHLNITVTDSDISGESRLKLRGLELTPADDLEVSTVKDQTSIPLNAAMGMLKDRHGNIDLKIPLHGRSDDPQFGIRSFIVLVTQKAALSATKSYLMKTFVPYANVVSVVMMAGEMALKVRFSPLPYAPAVTTPGPDQQQFIDQFILLLRDKPDTNIKICAVSTPEDIALPAGVKVTDAEAIKKLIAIGHQREVAFKDYVIEQGQIPSSRLQFCSPQIDSAADAIPRIKLEV